MRGKITKIFKFLLNHFEFRFKKLANRILHIEQKKIFLIKKKNLLIEQKISLQKFKNNVNNRNLKNKNLKISTNMSHSNTNDTLFSFTSFFYKNFIYKLNKYEVLLKKKKSFFSSKINVNKISEFNNNKLLSKIYKFF
jgi:hypothetical protein